MPIPTHQNFNPTEGIEQLHDTKLKDNPLPRAVLRPNSHYLLDGEWNFQLDPEDRGMQESWYLGHRYEHTAHWPGSVEAHMALTRGQQFPLWQDRVIAWYERDFPRPERSSETGKSMFQITFGACGYETRVWLNGRLLRTINGE